MSLHDSGSTSRSAAQVEQPAASKSPFESMQDRLREDRYDAEAWQSLVTLAEQSGDLEKIKEAYEGLLEVYPNTASTEIAYLNHHLTPPLFPTAEALFSRFLRPSPWVELWKFYLVYVRRVNSNAADPNNRNTIKKSYEFALNHIGYDKDSGEIWKDYIDFLKEGEARTTWDGQQKMDSLRSVYHRAVVIPLENVEVLWRELDAFENGLNKITAKKFLADLSPSYMTARTALRDLRRLLSPIEPASSTSSDTLQQRLPPRPTWTRDSDRTLAQAWKTYLKWEESNPLDIEDQQTLHTRISGAYKKAVSRMRFFPEIWYMAFHWNNSIGKTDEATSLLKQGMEANRSSFLLHFAFAELQEGQKNTAEVHTAFDSLLATLHTQLDKLDEALKNEVEAAQKSPPSNGEPIDTDAPAKAITEKWEKEIEDHKKELGVVWIMLMRFARRAEGLRPARSVFAKARKDKYCPWEVYEAAALMEYHCTKAADVATKIFEIGLKSFGEDAEFVLRYMSFLITINDASNAHALFERVIGNFTPEKARPLWERWARYEYQYGDLAASQKMEKRFAEVYSNDPPIKRFAARFSYLNVDAIASRDLGFAYRSNGTPGAQNQNQNQNQSQSQSQSQNQNQNQSQHQHQPPTAPASNANYTPPVNVNPKRAASPEPSRRRRDPSPPPHKRFKPSSPPPRERERERESRWDGPPAGRRVLSPRRDHPTPPRRENIRDEDKSVGGVPGMIAWFIGTLPAPSAFDGPKFRTDDLMELFRHGNIPLPSSGPPPRARSPPPRAGRPPPDYGPYQGPPGRGRRY
ncbi:hypothetical protein BOTBODRAFT_100538 [Botryobasidium botryosum FD-172 SS1]|uniref:mRNA 3'-end-processing protein RNA14 n=1 Tax=Botryobasidium botryosum (strain FD-172 SS1) TaxID=930990 RepID=A0A067N0J3_BOTB1|nr:hypothetical protein BOTBODRAFT_100538 [Botryobasidium botryosum FD-172 SS1]